MLLVQEKIGSWYSNPITRSIDTPTVGGGVGKYLKARTGQTASIASLDSDVPAGSVGKKRKVGGSSGELKDFSSW